MKGYGQFCPIAKATEIVGERWTPLILRELFCGSRHFNALRRGVPLMSPSLLSQRLKSLERAGIVVRGRDGTKTTYTLTPAGEELWPLIETLATWGQRWARAELEAGDLDAGLLMWDVRRNVDPSHLPPRRTVVHFAFVDVAAPDGTYWLVGDRGEVELCIKDPGYEVDLYVSSDLAALTQVWLGDLAVGDALAAERIELEGDRPLRESFRRWFALSPFAGVERPDRPAPGRGGADVA
jgi:DNA-binding HxlR family transcriptional regulator